MKSKRYVIAGGAGIAMLFASQIVFKQVGFAISSLSFVLWCANNVTGPHLDRHPRRKMG